jgi:hypothetical protein
MSNQLFGCGGTAKKEERRDQQHRERWRKRERVSDGEENND